MEVLLYVLAKLLLSDNSLQHICLSVSTCNNLTPLEGFSSHLIFGYFSKGCFEIQLSLKSDISYEYFTRRPIHNHDSISMNFRIGNFADKSHGKYQNTHFVFLTTFFWKSCCLWDNVETYSRARQVTDHNTIRHIRIAHCTTTAIETHSEYVILTAFPQQQWLHKCASKLHYMCIACTVQWLKYITNLWS